MLIETVAEFTFSTHPPSYIDMYSCCNPPRTRLIHDIDCHANIKNDSSIEVSEGDYSSKKICSQLGWHNGV